MSRATLRYQFKRDRQDVLRQRIREIARVRVRYGYKRIHVLLAGEGDPGEPQENLSALLRRGTTAAGKTFQTTCQRFSSERGNQGNSTESVLGYGFCQ